MAKTPWQTLLDVTSLDGLEVVVGVVGADAARIHPNGHGATVGEIAAKNHFGDGGNIPARPFLTVAEAHNERDLARVCAAAAKAVSEGRKSPEQALALVGTFFAGRVQEAVSDRGYGEYPANAPSTIARKGSSVPLIDSGVMRQAISWEIRRR